MRQPSGRKYRKLALALTFAASASTIGAAAAATIDLATTPLGTSTTGTTVKPNVMFILDASGSMNSDYIPDPVNPLGDIGADSQHAFNCRNDSTDANACARGDPPYYADKFNGLAYNPQFTYRAGVNFDGTSRGNQTNWANVPADHYDPSKGVIDLTTRFPEVGYCAASGCTNPRRNGVHNGTTFAYATAPKAAFPAAILFTRSNNKVTSSSNPGVHVGDVIDVVDAGASGCIHKAVRVTAETATSFSYEYGDASAVPCTPAKVNFSVVGYPEPAGPTAPRTTIQTTAVIKPIPNKAPVTVTFFNHGLIPGDIIDVTGGANCTTAGAGATVGAVTQDTFTYTAATANGQCAAAAYTIKRRPANIRKDIRTAPFYFTLSPTEYCADLHLTNCIAATAPTAAFPIAAYVRFCSSAALAAQAPPVSLVGGTPTCVDKYVAKPFPCASGQCGPYIYARYGLFTRGDIASGFTYPGRPGRTDCAAVPSCSFNEEMTNFANWYSYYRRRIQAMKTAAGIAFQNVDDRYRVGFILITPSNPVATATMAN